jgi:hypothetical protein
MPQGKAESGKAKSGNGKMRHGGQFVDEECKLAALNRVAAGWRLQSFWTAALTESPLQAYGGAQQSRRYKADGEKFCGTKPKRDMKVTFT